MTDINTAMTAFGEKAKKRVTAGFAKIFILGVFAGMFIALGACLANTAAFAAPSPNLTRLLSGLVFPVGLILTVTLGAELFTGAILLAVPAANREVSVRRVLRLLAIAFIGNFAGSLLIAAAAVYGGNVGIGAGALAEYTIKVAAAKCSVGFFPAFISGMVCNLLVVSAVLMSGMANSFGGKALALYIPIFSFVSMGFEHSIANMYFIGAGLFAAPLYPEIAANYPALTAINFLLINLLPVTLGNIVGGLILCALPILHGKNSKIPARKA